MSKTRFRSLVALELILLIFYWAWAIATAHRSSTPEQIDQNTQEASVRVPLIITLVVLAGEILQIAGLVGIGLLKGWARHAFLLGLALSFAMNVSSSGGDSFPAYITLVAGVYWINAGALLALSYTGVVWQSLRQRVDV